MASPARSRWILAAILLAGIAAAWWIRRRPPEYPIAYIADRAVTLYSTTAQVRQAVATLGYGERVAVLRRVGDDAEVRTVDGAHGWMDAHQLMDVAMRKRVDELLARAKAMPPQAAGHTKALSNVHAEPGRDSPRIFTFGRGVPVVVLERRVLAAPGPAGGTRGEEAGAAPGNAPGSTTETPSATAPETTDDEKPKQEDWLFVLRATAQEAGIAAGAPVASNSPEANAALSGGNYSGSASADVPIAGWVLGRFVALDPPQPIPDYSSSAGLHVVAWALLNTVPDAGGEKPQYLVAGTRGGEGQPCDFTLLRVYTWDAARNRYETAFVESDLCGRLPIQVQRTPAGPEFRFAELDEADGQRVYLMKQTVVRRVKQDAQTPPIRGKRP